jgi:Phage integrase family
MPRRCQREADRGARSPDFHASGDACPIQVAATAKDVPYRTTNGGQRLPSGDGRSASLLKVRAGAKGGKPRNKPIPRRTLTAVDAYLGDRAHRYGSFNDRARLFVRHDGTALTQQLVDRSLRRLATTAGVTPPEGAMAHALRHAYGMDLAMRGVPLSVIQQLLGHDDPRTTSIYTAAHAEDLSARRRSALKLTHACRPVPAQRAGRLVYVTVPASPSTWVWSPVAMAVVAVRVPTTAGMPRSRATMLL